MNLTNQQVQQQLMTGDQLVRVHRIGEYTIAEYLASYTRGATEAEFMPFIGDWRTSHAYGSLDDALLGAIGIKHLGLNTQFPEMARRMLGDEVRITGKDSFK